MYKIFDLSLPDAYIRELSSAEITTLVEEARAEHFRLEREIDELMWKDNPRLNSAHASGNANMPLPSEYSYDPLLYRDEFDEDPSIEGKLKLAKELSERVGLVMAVLGSALTQRAKLINLEAAIDREMDKG